jgi:cell division protein FtsB
MVMDEYGAEYMTDGGPIMLSKADYEALRTENAALRATVAELEARVEKLRGKLIQDILAAQTGEEAR